MSSPAINQSLTEFTNLTRADNILEVGIEINSWLGGLLGLFLWLAVVIIVFMISLYSSQEPKKALLVAFFAGSIISVPLYMTGLISGLIMYTSIIMLLLMIGINKASN
jgi:hypothetical protein